MDLSDLTPNPKNPRTVTPEKLSMLKASMAEFGDLSGIVFNVRSARLVGGHQRREVFQKGAIKITKTYSQATKTGTVALGHILWNGERFNYREVDFSASKEKAANIAANKGAGDWDFPKLTEMMRSLDLKSALNMDLTMFDEMERADFLALPEKPKEKKERKERDGKKRVECPECGHRFTPGWS